MFYFTIFHIDGMKVGGEFGRDAGHALDRWVEGALYSRDQYIAVQGVKGALKS